MSFLRSQSERCYVKNQPFYYTEELHLVFELVILYIKL